MAGDNKGSVSPQRSPVVSSITRVKYPRGLLGGIVSLIEGADLVEGKSDKELLKDALSDTGAVAVLYERYRDRILGCLIHTVLERDLAEELTETVFAKMVDNLPRLAHGSAPLVQWLYRVANNEAMSWFRHHRAEERYLARVRVGDGEPDPDYDNMVSEARGHAGELRAAVIALTPFERECVVLCYGEKLKPREVAALLGCTAKQVSNALQRACRILRSDIKANPGETRCTHEEEVRGC
jgi:RNA polymerase sigma-70 factor (ECF subfamily)